jgi:hypothetical protein
LYVVIIADNIHVPSMHLKLLLVRENTHMAGHLFLKLRTDLRAEPRNVTTPRAKIKRGEVTHRGYAVSSSNPSRSP